MGFDADKGEFLTFVHLDYDGNIDDSALVLDNSQDGDMYTYEEYGVVGESMSGDYLLDDGLIDYGYMAFIFRTGELVNTGWEDAGVAILFDGGFFTPLHMGDTLAGLDWHRQWNFVFKKTIPLFWYPAHTVTFLLPGDARVLFAALLGVILGILLAVAAHRK